MSDEDMQADAQQDTDADEAGNSQTDDGKQDGDGTPEGSPEPTSEPKPAEGDEEGEEDGKSDEPDGAPDEYTDFTYPEGVEVNDDTVKGFQDKAKELNLTQDQAQSLVDFYTGQISAAVEAQLEAHNAKVDKWTEETKADKEIGGDKLDENLGIVKEAIDKLGGSKLQEVLEESGLGSHPEILRAFYRVGTRMSEDTFDTSDTQPTNADKPIHERMWGSGTSS